MNDKQVVNELDVVETVGMWILVASIVLALCTGMTGCGFSASLYPVGEHEQHESYHATGLRCLFTNCGEGEAKGS